MQILFLRHADPGFKKSWTTLDTIVVKKNALWFGKVQDFLHPQSGVFTVSIACVSLRFDCDHMVAVVTLFASMLVPSLLSALYV